MSLQAVEGERKIVVFRIADRVMLTDTDGRMTSLTSDEAVMLAADLARVIGEA